MAPFTLFDFQRKVRSGYTFMPNRPWQRRIRLFNRFLLALLLVGGLVWFFRSPDSTQDSRTASSQLAEEDAVNGEGVQEGEDDEDTSPIDESADTMDPKDAKDLSLAGPRYQKDSLLGLRIDQLLRQYKPHAAFYLMVDASTNEILAWGGRDDSLNQSEPAWLIRSTFPSASLIKILTSTAALESGRFGINSTIPLIGRTTTLYNRQLRIPENYHGTTITLEDAFAKSCNPTMAIVGLHLGGHTMRSFAQRLGFNRPFPGGAPQPSNFLPPDTGYGLAEAACGFTPKNTISPLHVAAIVRALLKQEPLQIPWSHTIPAQYAPQEPITLDHTEFHPDTYYGMRQLFLRTISNGTARKQLNRTLYAINKDDLIIGGKTGSLDGQAPAGRYDWFAGFAQSKSQPQKAVIFVVMQVHSKIRTLPSPAIAGLLINQWSKETLGLDRKSRIAPPKKRAPAKKPHR